MYHGPWGLSGRIKQIAHLRRSYKGKNIGGGRKCIMGTAKGYGVGGGVVW